MSHEKKHSSALQGGAQIKSWAGFGIWTSARLGGKTVPYRVLISAKNQTEGRAID